MISATSGNRTPAKAFEIAPVSRRKVSGSPFTVALPASAKPGPDVVLSGFDGQYADIEKRRCILAATCGDFCADIVRHQPKGREQCQFGLTGNRNRMVQHLLNEGRRDSVRRRLRQNGWAENDGQRGANQNDGDGEQQPSQCITFFKRRRRKRLFS